MDIREIKDNFRIAIEYDSSNRDDSADDLSFTAGAQWDNQDAISRAAQGRPALILSKIEQYVRRIVGQSRSMSPSVRVVSADLDTPPEMAQLFEGIIRDIEQRNNANHARMNAHTDQVICGIGHYEVYYKDHESKKESQIGVRTIKNPLSVIWDPSSQEIDRSDAKFCYRLMQVPMQEFKNKFPNGKPISFGSNGQRWSAKYSNDLRHDKGGYVELCQYWEKYQKKHKFLILASGQTIDATDLKEEDILRYHPIESFEREVNYVRFSLCSGDDILEDIEDYPCQEIPIIPVIGEEFYTNNAIYRQGIVRKMREPQKLYNYMMSIGMEQLAQSVKSPFIVTNAMIEGNEDMWTKANTNALPFLAYEPDPNAPGASPQRVNSPTQHRDTMQAAQVFIQDISSAAGVHEEALGKETNAKSGKAILSRQAESTVMTNVFGHNLQASIRQEGRILVSMIKNLFTENKHVRIVTPEQKEDFVEINKKRFDYYSNQKIILNNMTQGNFEVRADSGPAYGSVKQEALNSWMQILKINPQMMPFILPQIVDLMDIPNQAAMKEAVQKYQEAILGQQTMQQGLPQQTNQPMEQL